MSVRRELSLKSKFRRFLQTLAVTYVATELLICCAITYIIFNSRFNFLLLFYFAWIYYDRNTSRRGGRQIVWLRRLPVYRLISEYFPMKLHKTVDLDPNKNYIFACHPHGIIGISYVVNFGTDFTGFDKLFPGIKPRGHTLNINFWIPFHRENALFNGALSADKESIEWQMTKNGTGNASLIVVGGAVESFDAVPNTMELTLKNRKGFIKLALKTGASLVPCLSFGENEIFTQTKYSEESIIKKIQNKLQKTLSFALPLFHGRSITRFTIGFLPYRKAINTVGKPIAVQKIENPTEEDINNLHELYIQSLTELFYANRDAFAENKNMTLIIK